MRARKEPKDTPSGENLSQLPEFFEKQEQDIVPPVVTEEKKEEKKEELAINLASKDCDSKRDCGTKFCRPTSRWRQG